MAFAYIYLSMMHKVIHHIDQARDSGEDEDEVLATLLAAWTCHRQVHATNPG